MSDLADLLPWIVKYAVIPYVIGFLIGTIGLPLFTTLTMAILACAAYLISLHLLGLN